MKKSILPFIIIVLSVFACGTQKEALEISSEEKAVFKSEDEEPVEIKDEVSEYEIIIIEPGFNAWLLSIARPEGYYSQQFMENRNMLYVMEWNRRVLQPNRYSPFLYEMQINYEPGIDYGYEVNYKLYNYFIYFQRKYNQRLGPYIPRI
ncbi:hypothetical protein GTQ34_03830 [Muricauda sp. JGD-17]|uniref:Lipoprotein n=1 Tax=Flagellimonas ochracea TaxID=2696472 RepID=A0A964TA32_9FLAO|nr:DUF6146 family protein [Allomuricauda ochracea]NAY91040.1 hypothetical protein [Allomuricauda ochracea]